MPIRRGVSLSVLSVLLASGCSLPGDGNAFQQSSEAKGAAPDAEILPAPRPRISPMTHLAAGQMLEQQGNLQGAISQYEKGIATDPRFAAAYNRLGIVYQKLARHGEAENIFRRGIQADATSAMLRNNLGYCYLSQNRLTGAETQFREALALAPDFKRARMNLAITLARAGRMEESLAQFTRAVPADLAHYNLGVICADLKDYDGAENAFRQALAINPDCTVAHDYLQRVTRLAEWSRDPPPDSGEVSETALAGDVGETANGE